MAVLKEYKIPHRGTIEEKTVAFILLSKSRFADKFDYSTTRYIKAKEKVEICCPIHGKQIMFPDRHLVSPTGCSECSKILGAEKRIKEYRSEDELTQFKNKAKLIHGDAFNYDKVQFKSTRDQIIITCNIHKIDFTQRVSHHLSGHNGCVACWTKKLKNTFSRSAWIEMCNEKNVRYPVLYIAILFDNEEKFVKIGITSDEIEYRQRAWKYEKETLNIIRGLPGRIHDLEDRLHKIFKSYQYFPKERFSGYTECFNLNILQDKNFQFFLQ